MSYFFAPAGFKFNEDEVNKVNEAKKLQKWVNKSIHIAKRLSSVKKLLTNQKLTAGVPRLCINAA